MTTNHPQELTRQGLRLCSLSSGESAIVEGFPADQSDFLRLESMGFRVGDLVTMLMPGRSCALAVGQTRLMVSRELLECVQVSRLE